MGGTGWSDRPAVGLRAELAMPAVVTRLGDSNMWGWMAQWFVSNLSKELLAVVAVGWGAGCKLLTHVFLCRCPHNPWHMTGTAGMSGGGRTGRGHRQPHAGAGLLWGWDSRLCIPCGPRKLMWGKDSARGSQSRDGPAEGHPGWPGTTGSPLRPWHWQATVPS